MASRLQSPTFNPLNLNPNNDDLERAQARAAARAASIRRRSTAFSPPPYARSKDAVADSSVPLLDNAQILDLFNNCIKLASENKINHKNTWELGLIDHLSEIVRVRSPDEDEETNFQKASCTLEAGVKIYSMRVDSTHSEAYKVLGGINRAGREEDKEDEGNSNQVQTEQVDGLTKKNADKKLSPLTTLESSFEALNVKKFDVAFTVDPLYHQTSAQFDEGGAKGLLLNNLGVYGGCRVLFDSFECPEKNILSKEQNHNANIIDLSSLKEHIEQMIISMSEKNDISPTLRDVVSHFDEDNRRPSDLFPVSQQPVLQEDMDNNDHSEVVVNAFDDCENFDHNDHASFNQDDLNDSFSNENANFMSYPEQNSDYAIRDPTLDQKLEKVADFLSLGLGLTSKSNAWAGPDHWKFRRTKGLEPNPTSDSESELASKKVKIKKGAVDLDFTKSLEKDMPDIFAPPKNPKSLVLPVNRAPCNFTLPEDCHYRPESLVRLFVLPDVMCLGKKTRKQSDDLRQDGDAIPFESWDDDSMGNDHFDNKTYSSDTEEPGTLVRPARQVNKVYIQYDQVSKQVDVHALKEMLWSNLQETVHMSDVESEGTVSLKQVLHKFSSDSSPIASSSKDISPHLFFICLLHLANEHCLSLHDCHTLDELQIQVPSSAVIK